MGYVLTDGYDLYIRRDDYSGKYVPVRSKQQAEVFTTAKKAKSILNNAVPKIIRKAYKIQYLETGEIIGNQVPQEHNNTEAQDKKHEVIIQTIEDDNIKDWISKISEIEMLMSGSEQRLEELYAKLSDIDKKVVDVQHYIELADKFNAYQGWQCFKMLRDLLLQRRKYKNEIAVLNMIKQCKFDTTSIRALSHAIAEMNNRTYSPRAIPDLFKEGIK